MMADCTLPSRLTLVRHNESGLAFPPLFSSLIFEAFLAVTVCAQLGDTQTESGVINAAPAIDAPPEPEIIDDCQSLTGQGTQYSPDDPRAPLGVFTITATFVNANCAPITDVEFVVKELSGSATSVVGIGGVGDSEPLPSKEDFQ